MWWLLFAGCGGADVDGDGFTVAMGDCDDLNPLIGPEQDEWCDGVDQDCDGTVDNDALDEETYYVDGDGDGYGDPDQPVVACERGDYEGDGSDCDDSDPKVNPGAADTDTKDRNCDGQVGEDAAGDWVGSCEPTTLYYQIISIGASLHLKDRDGALSGTADFSVYEGESTYPLVVSSGDLDGTRDVDDLTFTVATPDFGLVQATGTIAGDELVLETSLLPGSECTLTR